MGRLYLSSLALILAATRHVPREDRAVRLGQWQTKLGTRLAGKTLGLLGLGRIGGAVAAIGRAFDMSVNAWSENLTRAEAEKKGATAVGKDELFSQADILSVHLRLSGRTHGMVGRASSP